jgi:hypothetical protein
MVNTQFIYVAVGRGFETRCLHAVLTRRRKGRSLRTFQNAMTIQNFTFMLPGIVIGLFLNNQPDALIIQILML